MPENFQNVPAEKIRCKEGASSIAATWRGKHFSLINCTLPPPFWDVVDDDDDANVDIGDDDDDDIDDADIDIDGDDVKTFSLINFTLLPLWKDERSCLTFSKTLYSGKKTYYER